MEDHFIVVRAFLSNLTDNEVDLKVHTEVSDSKKRKAYNSSVQTASRNERINLAAKLIAEERTRKTLDSFNTKHPTPRDIFMPAEMAKLSLDSEPPPQDEDTKPLPSIRSKRTPFPTTYSSIKKGKNQ